MKCSSIFKFTRSEEAHTRYLVSEQHGKVVKNFPAQYKRGKNKGRRYIGCRKPNEHSPYYDECSRYIEWEHHVYTTLKFCPELNQNRAYGDSVEGHAVLFEISKDGKEISLYFFEGMKIHAQDIFNRWLEGDEISLLTESEKLSFILKKENAPED